MPPRSRRADWSADLEVGPDDGPQERDLDRIRAVLEARLGVGGGAPVRRIGGYLMLDRLGAGALAVVHRAYDDRVARVVALAVLRPERDSPTVRENLLHAALPLSRVSSAHLATVFEIGEHEGRSFVAMELVRGEPLRRWQTRRKPGWRAILSAYRQVAHGLADAEDAGLVFAAFEAERARIDAHDRVKLLPLGLVRAGNEAGAARLGFCAALYEALYNERPFVGETANGLARAIHAGLAAWPSHSDVPTWLRRVIVRELAVDPAVRLPSMRALAGALRDPLA